MRTLFRSQMAAFIASVFDLLMMIALVEGPGLSPVIANIGGNLSGGAVNFMVNRQWTFMATDRRIAAQAMKYLVVWAGYIGLSYMAIIIGTEWLGIHYLVVKIVSAVTLGIVYNFMLHKHFVYS